jgi:hypothetical protein
MAPPWFGTGGWFASAIVLQRTLSPWPSFRRRVRRLEVIRALPAHGFRSKAKPHLEINHILLAVRVCRRNRGRTAPARVILLRKPQIIFYIQKGSRSGHNRSTGFGQGPGWDTLAGSVGEQVIRCWSTLLARRFMGRPGRSLGQERPARWARPSAGHASRGPVQKPERGCCTGL